MIRGPVEYVPPVEVEVLMKRQAIPLDENEGIYVRDIKTGKVGGAFTSTVLATVKPVKSTAPWDQTKSSAIWRNAVI
jgi:hypothetical protein